MESLFSKLCPYVGDWVGCRILVADAVHIGEGVSFASSLVMQFTSTIELHVTPSLPTFPRLHPLSRLRQQQYRECLLRWQWLSSTWHSLLWGLSINLKANTVNFIFAASIFRKLFEVWVSGIFEGHNILWFGGVRLVFLTTEWFTCAIYFSQYIWSPELREKWVLWKI